MKTMPPDLFKCYVADPLGTDAQVRQQLNLPDNRYYVVTTWPAERAGQVRVDTTRTRVVHAKKVSKSDQQ